MREYSIYHPLTVVTTGKPPWSELSNQLTAMFTIATSEQPPEIPEGLSEQVLA